MTLADLARQGLRHYRRTHVAVAFGVATSVAVLAGSLLVGSSVRESLASIVTSRLGATDLLVSAETPFTESLSERVPVRSVPLFALDAVVVHQSSRLRAGNVSVYGVDDRFFAFHGVDVTAPTGSQALVSPDLAAELGVADGDALVVRVARPTDIPLDSLHGRKDDVGRAIRVTVRETLPADRMGAFSLSPSQGPVRAIYLAMSRVQRDLDQAGRVNALLVSREGRALSTPELTSALDAAVNGADLGVNIEHQPSGTTIVETTSGVVAAPVHAAVTSIAARRQLQQTDVLSWMANTMAVGERSLPYSLVVGLGPDAGGDTRLASLLQDTGAGDPPLVLNTWAANDLGATVGQSITVEYYRWADEGRLVTERASFRVAGIVPIEGLAADRRLTPPYPGITDAETVGDWDPPFPIDLSRVRPTDEEYWERYRTTAKAFVPLEVAQELWRTKYGEVSSVRLRSNGAAEPEAGLADAVASAVGAVRGGLLVTDVREQNLTASTGATDFGAYFSYFSFFLVVSALLLTALFFRLGIEQRLREIGVLRAAGYSLGAIRGLFLREGAIVAAVGAALGVGLAIAWAALMMYGLRTWWVGAVGTTALALHVDVVTLAAGAAGGIVAALFCIWLTIRAIGRFSPRELLSGSTMSALTDAHRGGRGRRLFVPLTFSAAVSLTIAAATGGLPAAAGFFGAGGLTLVGGLLALGARLRTPRTAALSGRGLTALASFGWRNAAWRPGRSMTSAGLVAVAAFLLVSVDAFRKSTDAATTPQGGTGGFGLMAETVLPLVHNPATFEGRESLGLQFDRNDQLFSSARVFAARLRPGDDASCLNLYQPKQPRVIGVTPEFIEANRFTFAKTVAQEDAASANPWRLLLQSPDADAVPAIADATSLQYVLHAAVGDTITIDAETARPIRLHIVGSLSDSVLQGELIIAEREFQRLFPDATGYRVLLVDGPETPELAQAIEERLEPFGADVQSTIARLDAYHRVENTYLSTFQALGGLGLMLGTVGLAAITARNVLERRRELALLTAAGYRLRDVSTMVVAENVGLVAAGLGIGVIAALLSIAPVLIERGGRPPALSMVWLAAVAAAGVVAALLATRAVRRLPLLGSLRSE